MSFPLKSLTRAAALIASTGKGGVDGLKVALIYGLTGPLQADAKHTEAGLKLEFGYVAKRTIGVDGRRIKDDQGKPDLAQRALAEAYEDDGVDIAVRITSSAAAVVCVSRLWRRITRSDTTESMPSGRRSSRLAPCSRPRNIRPPIRPTSPRRRDRGSRGLTRFTVPACAIGQLMSESDPGADTGNAPARFYLSDALIAWSAFEPGHNSRSESSLSGRSVVPRISCNSFASSSM